MNVPFSRLTQVLPSASIRSILLIPFEDQELPDQVRQLYPTATISILWKKDLAGLSPLNLLRTIRHRQSDLLVASLRHSTVRRTLSSVQLLLSLSGSRHLVVRTGEESIEEVHRLRTLGRMLVLMVTGLWILLRTWFLVVFKSNPSPPLTFPTTLREDEKRKVLFVRPDLGGGAKAGGSISHVKGMVRAFCKAGYDVIYVSDAVSDLLPNEVVQIPFPPSSRLDVVDEFQLLEYDRDLQRHLKTIIAHHKPDLLYQRHALFSVAAGEVARAFHLPLILEANDSEVWVKKRWSRLLFERLAVRCEHRVLHSATRVAVISKRVSEQLQPYGLPQERLLLNPNGVDPEEFHPDIDGGLIRSQFGITNQIVVGFIGTFTRWHGVETLFEAASIVCQTHPSISFLFIGDGDLRATLEKQAEAYGTRMIFTGLVPHPDAPRTLAACDILVSPHLGFDDGTAFFGSPTKLFEYMAMGKAIIASRLEQIAEVIRDGENGLHMKPGNALQLSDLIVKLSNDQSLRERLGAQARKDVVARYTWDGNVERISAALGLSPS